MIETAQFPPLIEPYASALQAAITFVLDQFDPLSVIASGSIVRGQGGPSSDLDIYVLHAAEWRQRVQRKFNGVPAEIFINNAAAVRAYFAEERRAGRPITAHMWATGFVVLSRDTLIDTLRAEAQAWLGKRPDLLPTQLLFKRYLIADSYDNAKDLRQSDPVMAAALLHDVVRQMIEYTYLAANHNLPRIKETISALGRVSEQLQTQVINYYQTSDIDQLFALAQPIAAQTIGVDGFFEWESERATFP